MKLKRGWVTALAVSTFLLTVVHQTFGQTATYVAVLLVSLFALGYGVVKKRRNTPFFVQSPCQKG